MKKVILFSFFIFVAASVTTSCTAEAVDAKTVQQNTLDDIGGGQNGQLPPPKLPK